MPSGSDFSAVGKILALHDDAVIFQPLGSTYELRLATAAKHGGPSNERIHCFIRASGRKIWTVPSGGNFIVPIAGPPRIVQGRIKYLDEKEMVVQAGAPVVVELPKDAAAYDLACGELRVGGLVNATILPWARIEVLAAAAAG